MTGKGSDLQMSDECLIGVKRRFTYYVEYQAVMRKFTLAGKSFLRPLRGSSHLTHFVNFVEVAFT